MGVLAEIERGKPLLAYDSAGRKDLGRRGFGQW